jgi:hypothetical protein
MAKHKIEWAPREKKRSVYSAVGRNFLKTLTEPITNADSILKRKTGVSHAAGLVDEMLTLKLNDRVNTTELKGRIPKKPKKVIKIELVTAGKDSRITRVIDAGLGMSTEELETKFGTYASAKAKGEKTRSLFGRGALDVLLYHDDAAIFSVQGGTLSSCRIYWDKGGSGDPVCEVENLGAATKKLLDKYDLPHELAESGTVVEFRLKEKTHIPNEEQIIAKISSFYMLRLIASDPNTRVLVDRLRADGNHEDALSYDFPIGTVVGRFDDNLDLGKLGKLPVAILVARSDVALESDPVNIDRRENGLLFVDENDAVLDLTLLPEYDRSPYLKHIYGIVRITGMRGVLEAKLEDDDAEAVLTATRDGFDHKNEITQQLFALVERHVKEIYAKEEKQQKKGSVNRSEKLDHRVKEALKLLNQFNADETDEDGTGPLPPPLPTDAIFFSIDSARLHAGLPKRIFLYVNLDKVNEGEIVLFGSDHTAIKVEPDSEIVAAKRKNQTHQRIELTVSCDLKGPKGIITALSLDKDSNEVRASLRILGVDDPPLFEPPEDIDFTASRYSGDPNRPSNNAVLLVNLKAFSGYPEVTFWLEEVVGNVSLGSGGERIEVKVTAAHKIEGHEVARVPIPFRATGWGQRATLCAKAKRSEGKLAHAKCKIRFEHQQGDQKFSNFHYEDLGRLVMGDVAGDKLYVNAGYGLHRKIFGDTEDDFNSRLETDSIAQMRAVAVLVETTVYHTATTRYRAGGKKGLQIDPDDPIGTLRPYLEESRMKLEPRVLKALAPEIGSSAKEDA